MNRIGSTSVPVSFCAPATMTATMSRTHFHHHRPPDNASPAAIISDPPTPCNSVCPITATPFADHSLPGYDPDLPINSINTITLPNFRNLHKINSLVSGNVALNPNFPKSISTWGPLHKNFHWKNISFKSYSRDSGHGGSEQEESPRPRIPITDRDGRLTLKDTRRQPYISELDPHANLDGLNIGEVQAEISNYLHKKDPVQKQLSQGLQQHMRKKLVVGPGGNCFLRPGAAPWNHTYTEIHDERMRHCDVPHSEDDGDTDPVYEEIERGEIQDIHISDMSDEDGKRQSDMSRQSSRSYGDHRPLIPHSPATMEHVSHMESQYSAELEHHYRIGLGLGGLSGWSGLGREMSRQNMYRGGVGVAGENARSLAAVLDGETVVCHLEPPEFFAHDLYNTRTVVMPPNGES